jgi:pyruvate/2-oxoglutarate dehydrogenase complex dihydrolipoamide acyltransferase (E2) component
MGCPDTANTPILNGSLIEDEFVLDDVHLGIAAALGEGLIVPVIRQYRISRQKKL